MLNFEDKQMTKVLVVDDTPSQKHLISTYISDGGYHVIDADNAREALKKASLQKPDVIVTDVVMPGMSGFELCRILKKDPETKNIKIVICTSKDQKIDRLWAMKLGADVYLIKPFTRDEIIKAIADDH